MQTFISRIYERCMWAMWCGRGFPMQQLYVLRMLILSELRCVKKVDSAFYPALLVRLFPDYLTNLVCVR